MWKKKIKELTLSQLIEYVIKEDIKGKYFVSKNGYKVYFTTKGELIILCNQEKISTAFPLTELFEVEMWVFVYDLDTVIPRLLTMNVHGIYREHHYKSINQLPFYESYFDQYTSMYVVQKDNVHTLLWNEGKLVNEGEVYYEESKGKTE